MDCNHLFSGKEEATKIEIKKITRTITDINGINQFLIDTIAIPSYEDDTDENSTAYGALVLHEADDLGFTEAMVMLLKAIGITNFEVFSFKESNMHGIKIADKVYAPFVQKLCGIANISYENWIKEHL